jgi:HTH-type transcriptional regulator / antitoxin HigA
MSAAICAIYASKYHRLMRQFPLRPLRGKRDAEKATEILDRLFREHYDDAGEEAYVTVLAQLLADYEEKHDPTPDTAAPLDVLRLLMEEHELTQAALGEMLGTSQSLVSMILSGARPITVEHANRLGERFRVDASLFLDLKRSREI